MGLGDFLGDIISPVTNIVGGLFGTEEQSGAADKSGDALRYGADQSAAVQRYMFDQMMSMSAPYREAGAAALPELQGFDPTAEMRPRMEALEGMPGLSLPEFDYSFDENDPGYQFRKKELEKTINQASAARGNYNSRPTINALGEGNLALTADETDRQFGRAKDLYSLDYHRTGDQYSSEYGKMADLYNMSSQLGLTDYNKLLDLVKIGQGSSAQAGAGAMATGQGLANTYGQLGKGLSDLEITKGQTGSDLFSGLASQIGPMLEKSLPYILGVI